MKNKSTSKFITIIFTCVITIYTYAQKNNINNDFSIDLIKHSEKSNLEKEHFHIIELKNNSNLSSSYSITVKNKECADIHSNKKSFDKSSDKKHSGLITEIYLNDLNNKQQINNPISLKPNESVKIYLKTKQQVNTKLDSKNCTKISALKLTKSKSKVTKSNNIKSVTIETYVRNPNNRGH